MSPQAKSSKARLTALLQGILQLFNAFLLLVSPLMVIGFLIGAIVLATEYGEHRQFVRRMETSGLVAQGVVTSASRDYGWIFVRFTDDQGEERTNVLEMAYYPDAMWDALTPESSVTVRYLPYAIPGSDRIVLHERFYDVQDHRGFISQDLVGLCIVCWLVLVVKPQILYVGLIDKDTLMGEGLQL